MQTLVKETVTLHKVLSRYLSVAVVEVRSNDTVFRFFSLSSSQVLPKWRWEAAFLVYPALAPRTCCCFRFFFECWDDANDFFPHWAIAVCDDRSFRGDQSSFVGSVREY